MDVRVEIEASLSCISALVDRHVRRLPAFAKSMGHPDEWLYAFINPEVTVL